MHANQAAQHELGRRRVLTQRHGAARVQAGKCPDLAGPLAKVMQGKRSLISFLATEGAGLGAGRAAAEQAPRGAPQGGAAVRPGLGLRIADAVLLRPQPWR